MPLIKRLVQPVDVSRNVVPQHITNELECVANSTLAHIVRQLGSLSAHADDLFSELHREATGVICRVAQLTERIERVKGRIVKLNPTVEEVLLQDINMRKPFKSSVIKEQQIITHATRPEAINIVYQQCCEPPPPLHILNSYREDGRDSMKFYTDPGYFIELWCQEIAKDTENQMKKHRHKGRQRNTRTTKEQRTIREPKTQRDYADRRHGPEFVENLRHSQTSNTGTLTRQSVASPDMRSSAPRMADIQRTGSLKSPTGTSGSTLKAAEVSRTVSLVGPKSGGSRKSEALPSPPLYQQQVGGGTLPDYPPPVYTLEQQPYIHGGYYQQEMSPAEMALRGISARQAAAVQMSRSSSISPSPSMGLRPNIPPPAPPASGTPTRIIGMDGIRNDAMRGNIPPPIVTAQSTPISDRDWQPNSQSIPAKSSPDLPPPPAWQSGHAVPQPSMADRVPSPPVSPAMSAMDHDLSLPSPPSFLPPPPLAFGLPGVGSVSEPYWDGAAGAHGADATSVSIASDANSDTSSMQLQRNDDGLGKGNVDMQQPPMVRDTRCDLLSAIREGIQLRKVEERRQKSEQKHQQQASSSSSTGRLDVQAIMEAAFELRRKALEDNDSDDDDDFDGQWSDNE